MDNSNIRVDRAENGYVMTFTYDEENGDYKCERYIATTKAKLVKMVKNTVNLIAKEQLNAD
jgi:hypothetical protein